MEKQIRTKDFKIGTLHGKLNPCNMSSQKENLLKNYLFYKGKLKIGKSGKQEIKLRIFAYEFPLYHRRDECVDLLAYDEDKNLYLIELKDENSSEHLHKVIDQINGYAGVFNDRNFINAIQKEFEETFFFPIKFNEIKKIILAGRKYYEKEKAKQSIQLADDIILAYFARIKDVEKNLINNINSSNKVDWINLAVK